MQRFYGSFLSLCLALLAAGSLYGQNCNYELELTSNFDAAWAGSFVTIFTDSDTTDYALDQFGTEVFDLNVANGDTLVMVYTEGFNSFSIGFTLRDNDGNVLYTINGPFGLGGQVLVATSISCPACPAPELNADPELRRLRSTSVDLAFRTVGLDTAGNEVVYLVEYGPAGFVPGDEDTESVNTTDTIFRIQPLIQNTAYDVYLSTICFEGQDTSDRLGPYSFVTPFIKNVGASVIYSPESGCELGLEELEIGLTNFGGQAQTLIPFNFSINDVPGQVMMPNDGLYTGVLGVDSTETTSFDNMIDLSQPGEYVISVWTELAGDSLRANDTITRTFIHAPTIVEYPYYEPFEEGNGLWSDQVYNEDLSSWEYGQPDGNVITSAAGGDNAWVTNLDGSYLTGETSFLYSPCFDLSEVEEPVVVNFSFFNAIDFGNDYLQLEVSLDGETYNRVGNGGEGINWYNDQFNNWWDNDFGTGQINWLPSAILVDSLAGESQVRFRFRFESDPFGENTLDGAGIDNFLVTPQTEVELAGIEVRGPEGQACTGTMEFPTISFFNLGSSTADNITVSYQANGGDIVTETFPNSLASFQQAAYTFTVPYDGTQADEIELVAWVSLEGDDFQLNDTVSTTIEVRRNLPFYEDFESGFLAVSDWELSPAVQVGEAHNSGSSVLYANLYTGQQEMQATTPLYGSVEDGDSLSFDYRFVNWSAGTVGTPLADGDSLSVDLILDCGDEVISSFISINSANHVTSAEFANVSMAFPPETYGRGVQVVFNGVWDPNGFSDFFLDIDNLNLKRCAGFDLEAEIVAYTNEENPGSITVFPNAGIDPYTYAWNDSTFTQTFTGLDIGNYTVTVTDVQGCTDEATFVVVSDVDDFNTADELASLSVFPNPTSGQLQLRLELAREREVQVQVLNQFGQRLAFRDLGRQWQLNESFDLSGQPAGVYFLQVYSEGVQRTVRVVKTR
ncbi:hypothetical protein CEQ90_11235 [Lewinellaceae bacterium SD302]|nr:hypothetical protein CEQ90_11235 [Lewinellaceae bacterium SD302]